MENSNSFTRIILLGFTVLILSISSKAYSALAEADWMIGDKAITIDDNGLRWLDLSFTRSKTYNEVTALLAAATRRRRRTSGKTSMLIRGRLL